MVAARAWVAGVAALCGLATACGGPEGSDAPSATVAAGTATSVRTSTPAGPTTTTSEAPATGIEDEVEAAYLRSWDVYTEAMLRLDPSRLEQVYAGDALELRRREIATAPNPVRVQVEHDYEIAVVGADTALVFETYRNHSVYLDETTLQPVEPDPNNVLSREYVLQKEPAGWRVTRANAGS